MNKEKKICLWIIILLSWFIGYEVFIALHGTIDIIRYCFAYGYSILSLFIIAAVFLAGETKEE